MPKFALHMTRLLGISICMLLCGYAWAQTDALQIEIEKIIKYDTSLDLELNPGMMIAVIDGDSTYYVSLGYTDTESYTTASPEDIYELGSVTKSFTALLTQQLAIAGKIDLDADIDQYLSATYQNPRVQFSIRDLLEHKSGLPIRPQWFGKKAKDPSNPYRRYLKSDLLKYYSQYIAEKEPGKYSYAHSNYGFLEIVLEAATGQAYDILLQEYLLKPLQMYSTAIRSNREQELNITNGYDRASRKTAPWEFGSFAASEGLKSSIADLAKYVRAQWTYQPSLAQAIQNNQAIHTERSLSKDISSASGWQVFYRTSKDAPIYTSSGMTSGHRAFIAWIKETKTGVIVLSNSTQELDNLPLLILRMINYNWKRKA